MKNNSFIACIALTCLIALATGMTPDPSLDKSDFVMIADEIPEVMLEVRYYTTYNFVGDRINGYNAPVSYITKEAAAALKIASDNAVKDGYRIRVYDAYRPQDAVDHFKAWAKDIDDTRMKEYFYPDLDKSVLFKLGYIASRSGHSRGSTIDLTLFDMSTGHNVDMGGTFDFFGELSHPEYKGVTPEQYANRMYLRKLMMDAGFRPYSEEWWHFTLVDEPFPDTYFNFPNE